MRTAVLILVAMGSVGCGNDLAQDLFSLLSEAEELQCTCAVSEGVYDGSVAECRATQGANITQAQIDCVQAAFDNHASSADEDIANCQIGETEDALDCYQAASCSQLLNGTSGCTIDTERCGEISAALQTATDACF